LKATQAYLIALVVPLTAVATVAQSQDISVSVTIQFEKFKSAFDEGYEALYVRDLAYDYRLELQSIPSPDEIERQQRFFLKMDGELKKIHRLELNVQEQLQYDHLDYEINFNLQRLNLELGFRMSSVSIPVDGMSSLPGWYQYRIQRFTSVDVSPEELFAFGEREVRRVQREIRRLRDDLGYANDSIGFYIKLASEEFILNDKEDVLRHYEEIRTTVYNHLENFVANTDVSEITFMEWVGADQFTPPGYYSPENAYGIPVFHFNFYNQRHNIRSMDWLFLHEAVPGHHYQWWMRNQIPDPPAFKRHFSYPGNFEGWAAYVEYFGKELGLYRDPYSEHGKWEWDLVRSTRILIDVGIHHHGWTKEEAIACWMKYIRGQDEIAEREVIRCMNWPAQALSYKVGAWKIQKMADRLKQENPDIFSLAAFHQAYLMTGQTPLSVVDKNIAALMQSL
jgi:uncharacterized protein (DUF885 family)